MDLGKQHVATFDPRAPAYRRKLWVRIVTPTQSYVHVFWRRIAALLAVLAIAAWLGLAGAAWAFVKYRRGYAGVQYFDLAFYPFRAAHYRAGIGRHYLAEGRAAFERQDFREGYSLMTAGLARVPDATDARRLVALAEVRFGRPDRASKTLIDGLPYAREDLDYLKLLFGLLLELQEDDHVISLAQSLLPPQRDDVRAHQFIALEAATAHYHRGRADQVEKLIADWQLEKFLEAQILLARCDWDHGLRTEALERLEGQVARFRQRDEIYLELVRLHREAGHADDTRRYALLRQFNNPKSPGPRIDLLHSYRASGDTAAEQRELAAYFDNFSSDAAALQLLAWFAVDTVQPALAERIQTLASEKGFPLQTFTLARTQASLAARDYAGALALTDGALRNEKEDTDYQQSLFTAMRAIALFGLGDATRGQVILTAFLEHPNVRASDALSIARQLKQVGATAQARRVLERACTLDARNQPALAELVRLDAETGNRVALAENLPKLLSMRKHSRDVLETALAHLDEPADAPLREQILAALGRKVTQ